jgi:type IV pilus assembly protein PilQ
MHSAIQRVLLAGVVAMFCVAGDAPTDSDTLSAPSPVVAADTSLGAFGESGDRVDVGEDGRIDVRMRDLHVFDALDMLAEQTQRNIVVESGVQGSVSLVLRRVTFEEALRAVVRATNLRYEIRDGIIYVFQPKGEEAEPPSKVVPREVRVFRLNYVTAMAAEEFLRPLLTPECTLTRSGQLTEGIGSDKESAGGFSAAGRELIVIIAPPDQLRTLAAALAEFDVRPPQVLVEATIMRATLNDQNALGIDFNTLLGIDLQMLNAGSQGITDLTLGSIPFDRLDNFNSTLRTDFNDRVPQGGLTFGIVKDQVAGFVRALEQLTDVTIMANPKLLVLNKQRGEVIVGRRDGYQTTTVTETAAIQTVEYLETGTKLIFRPFVTGAGDVRMEIHPEDSNGGLTAANLPFQETTETTTNILLKDGHSILIGGLFRERTNSTKSQVPVVGNVPVLGNLFGVQQDQTVREEVIILLTVHVLTETESEDALATKAIEDIERVRVGAREGLMGTGREVLAEARYRQALDELRGGDAAKALQSVRTSLQLNPRNLDAIRLREELENERTWRSNGVQMRSFLQEMLNSERGTPAKPFFGIPDPVDSVRAAEISSERSGGMRRADASAPMPPANASPAPSVAPTAPQRPAPPVRSEPTPRPIGTMEPVPPPVWSRDGQKPTVNSARLPTSQPAKSGGAQ